MPRHYLNPSEASDKYTLPTLEVFFVSEVEARGNAANDSEGEESSPMTEEGWYYWFCLPGCMPDSDAFGPFESEEAALKDARDTHGDE